MLFIALCWQSYRYHSLCPGYIGAIAARFWHALVKSIVLINSAGNVVPGYSSVPFTKVSLHENYSSSILKKMYITTL